MAPPPSFWLIRHAESTWNAAGRWQGQADPPLTARGRRQASTLAGRLAEEGLEVLVASDLARTAETAGIVGGALGLEPRLEPGLRELDAGSWSGLGRAEIESRYGPALAHFDAGHPDARAGGAECRREVAARARRALRAVAREHATRRVAVVTHSGVMQSLLPRLRLGHAEWRVVEVAALLGAAR
ncbi:MAG: histidine phosphatase family protein [Myxococcota bacterium]|nr:histidine phosphatase family protein [Myxococcota bacterium]